MHHTQRRATPTALAAIAVAVLPITGCSAGGGNETNDTDSSISVATLQTPYFEGCFKEVLPKFTEKTGIKVNLTSLPYNGMFDKYQTTFASGQAPYDLMSIAFQWTGQFAAAGNIEPVKDRSVLDGISQSIIDQYSYQGDIYAVPYTATVYGYFYRTDILDRMGLKYPETQEDLLTTLRVLADDPQLKAEGVSPISVMGAPQHAMTNFNSAYRSLGGPALEDDASKPNPIDVGIAEKAFTSLKAQVDLSPPSVLTATFTTTPPEFAAGKVVFLPQFNGTVGSTFESPDSKVKGNYTMGTVPGGAGDLSGFGNAVVASSTKKEQATELAKYMSSPEVGRLCAQAVGKGPVQTENFKDEQILAQLPYLPAVLTALETAVPRYTGPKAGTFNDIVDGVTAKFLAGQVSSARDAAQELAAQIAAAS